METKITKNGNVTLVEILKNGNPVNAQNPATVDDLAPLLDFEEEGNEVAIVSGMPGWAVAAIVLKLKNLFTAIATYDPKLGGGVIVHSLTEKYKVGNIIPLE
ncbi:MAG: CRISPR-associated protein Csx3 [Desertifilum sp.]|nr:CRISPR-associated protein Csx3 [Desertifilum sp.]